MHMQMDNFDPIDQLGVSIYTFDINIKQIQWKTMKYIEMYPNLTYLHAHTYMHVQANYFDHAVQLGTSISIYCINLN
jgi:hypothetical protein